MFAEQFKKLELDDTATILDLVSPHLDVSPLDPLQTIVLGVALPFYKGYQFLDISDYGQVPALRFFVLYNAKTGDAIKLNWTNEPIYALNKKLPIALSEKNVTDYVRFFLSYVRGKHGRFIPVENVDDIAWREDPPPAARRAISKMITPITLETHEKGGDYKLKACMMFRDSLFKADISVKSDGAVHISGEELLIEDMPVLDDVLGQ
ncbi:MAG TPA: hypothetical protein PLO23_08765 [Alphaproteobacteria bacterium]|nr:hypothetical protein [Alphaproteobacteria bacterium]